jgi:hypothetical protein
MCIYLTSENDLTYAGRDHIIPAAIGGINELPNDFVSDKFNNGFSGVEREFLQRSIISIPRLMIGPGKRGNLNPQKATKSSISLFRQFPDNNHYTLGYTKAGKPYEIPHVIIDKDNLNNFIVGVDASCSDADYDWFKDRIANFNDLSQIAISAPDLPENLIIVGIAPGIGKGNEIYIAGDVTGLPFELDILLVGISSSLGVKPNNADKYQVRVHGQASLNEAYYRSCAKIAFNTLAYFTSEKFVKQSIFDPIRNWIVNGGENSFVSISPNFKNVNVFPSDSHQVLITWQSGNLVADVCFYNHFHNSVIFAKDFPDKINLTGLICDWQNRKEDTLNAFLTKKRTKEAGLKYGIKAE